MVMKNCKRRMKNLSVAWIDYMKAYDVVPHTWILQCLKNIKLASNIRNMTEKFINYCEVELISEEEMVKVKKKIKIEASFKETVYHQSSLL